MFEHFIEERRKAKRAHITIAVKRIIKNQVDICQASNISIRGIFIATVMDDIYPSHAKCWLEFSLPNSDILITARGVIIRQLTYSRFLLNAIRFDAIAPSHRRLIIQYINGPHVATLSPTFIPPTGYR